MQSRIIILLCSLFTPSLIKCSNTAARNERTFPNGSISGIYTYVDTQGNLVHLKYYADAESYSIILKGSQLPDKKLQNNSNRTSDYVVTTDPTTELLDIMVPLKLEFPEPDKMYTVLDPRNATGNEDAKRKSWAESDEKDDQPIDYDTFDPALHNSKSKTREKEKGYKKFIRKIRQTLDGYKRKIPSK